MNIFKKLNLFVASFGLLFAFVALPATVSADHTSKHSVCQGVQTATGENCDDPDEAKGVIDDTVRLIVNTLSLIVGIVAVIMIIIGGLKYITSSGDSNNVSSAKNTILYAIIGLVIVVLAQVIVRFVLTKVGQ